VARHYPAYNHGFYKLIFSICKKVMEFTAVKLLAKCSNKTLPVTAEV